MLDPRLLVDLAETMFKVDVRGRLTGGAPHLYLVRTPDTALFRYHADLPEEAALRIGDVVGRPRDRPTAWAQDYADLLDVLCRLGRLAFMRAGPLYMFPPDIFPSNPANLDGSVRIDSSNAHLLRSGLEEWIPDAAANVLILASIADGKAVSVCASASASRAVHCAGVETLPAYRGRGYAAKAVAAWSNAVRSTGARPFYATTFDNVASQKLASRLGLRLVGAEFSARCAFGRPNGSM